MTEGEKALRQALIRSQLPTPKEKKFTIILSPRQQKALDRAGSHFLNELPYQ